MKPSNILMKAWSGSVHTGMVFLLFLSLCSDTSKAQPGRYQTRNVFIVAIDGIRNAEAFESGSQYMPFVWDSLRPLGTIYSNFQNRGITVTNSGHSTIVSGVRQLLPNNSGIPTPIRPKEPTLGEYYRKALGVPQEKVHYISGKNTIWRYPVSLYPGYGYEYAPTITLATSADTVTWDSACAVIDRDHPSLCYVLFAEVDKSGHTGDTAKYLGSIRLADSLVFALWKKLQSDSVYRDKTTMIVTTDHGRHDDSHGGWQGHGDYCHGCRHIPFFAIGPDIRVNTAIGTIRDHIDIAPTVAELLGFESPLAQGEVMSEMLTNPGSSDMGHTSRNSIGEINISSTPGRSRSCALAANQFGLHAVFSDNSGANIRAYYTRSTDQGNTWTPPQILFPGSADDELEPVIAACGDSGLFVACGGYRPVDSSFVWILKGLRSTSSGDTWEPEILIDTLRMISCKPSISVSGNRISVTTMQSYRNRHYRSNDGGITFSGSLVHGSNSLTPSCTVADTTSYVVWQYMNKDNSPYWNIVYDYQPWKQTDIWVTNNDSNSYSYDPFITDIDSTLHLAFSNLPDASMGNRWAIHYERNTDLGNTWTGGIDISQNRIGFSPVIKTSDNGSLHAVWADYSNDSWSIWGTYSVDQGLFWSEPYAITSWQSFSIEPDFTVKGDTVYLVWQDMREGNWEIFFKRFPVTSSSLVELSNGWNIVSVPVTVQDPSASSLFPWAVSGAFAFDGTGYVQRDTLYNGVGYWVKFDSSHNVNIVGLPRLHDTLDVLPGWNLIGSITDSVSTAGIITIPSGIIVSPFYGYDSAGYAVVNAIAPGAGFWVKTLDSGMIVLSSGIGLSTAQSAVPATRALEGFGVITFKDASGKEQSLYFGGDPGEGFSADFFAMPPVPPAGIFNARFQSGRMLEVVGAGTSMDFPIIASPAKYPLTATWDLKSQDLKAVLNVDGHEVSLRSDGPLRITNAKAHVALVLSGFAGLPGEFALRQNYPNPFNSTTVISYELRMKSGVRLRVYDLLGREVATLVDEIQDAGFKSVRWDATDVATGVYFYRITAGKFTAANKMLLVR